MAAAARLDRGPSRRGLVVREGHGQTSRPSAAARIRALGGQRMAGRAFAAAIGARSCWTDTGVFPPSARFYAGNAGGKTRSKRPRTGTAYPLPGATPGARAPISARPSARNVAAAADRSFAKPDTSRLAAALDSDLRYSFRPPVHAGRRSTAAIVAAIPVRQGLHRDHHRLWARLRGMAEFPFLPSAPARPRRDRKRGLCRLPRSRSVAQCFATQRPMSGPFASVWLEGARARRGLHQRLPPGLDRTGRQSAYADGAWSAGWRGALGCRSDR